MPNTHPPIRYTITDIDIAKHLFCVCLSIPSASAVGHILSLPAWIPGSYMIRDFAKHITQLSAQTQTGEPLDITAIDKQRWRVAPHAGAIAVQYQVYALDLSVRSAYLDSEFGFANGTSLFLEVDHQTHSPGDGIEVVIKLPQSKPNWQLATAMSPMPDSPDAGESPRRFYCRDYADLIEHPLLLGELVTASFTLAEITFELVFVGHHSASNASLDTSRMAADVAKIAQHHLNLFDSPAPMSRYVFLTMLTESDFGGLEHTASTALMYSRDKLPSHGEKQIMSKGYRGFLSLCSHELLHTWHVKRTKPAAFIAPDLSREIHTEQLWIYEGFTSYYDDFSLRRTGLISHNSYLELLAQNLTKLRRCKGRLMQTVTASSWFAWTKFYQQDENAANAIVSYYTKGSIIALCLDLKLRLDSDQRHSLDTVMGELWRRYGQLGIGTQADVIGEIVQALGYDYQAFLHHALYTTEELPVAELLQQFGVKLHYRPRCNQKDPGGTALPPELPTPVHEFGAQFKSAEIGVGITHVSHDSPAEQALLTKGDQLLAINAQQVTASNLSNILDKLPLGTSAEVHYFRRGKLHQSTMPIQAAPLDTVYLTITDPEACQRWLG